MRRLNMKQEAFCHAYVANEGNGSKSYKEAYHVKDSAIAEANASRLLRDDRVQQRIKELRMGFYEQKRSIMEEVFAKLKSKFDETDDPRSIDKLGRTLLEAGGAIGGAKNQQAVIITATNGQVDLDKMSVLDLHNLKAAVEQKIGGRGVWTEMIEADIKEREQTS